MPCGAFFVWRQGGDILIYMNKTFSITGSIVFLILGVSLMPIFAHAQQEVDPGTTADIISITENAEAGIMNVLPQGVKDFLSQTFHSIETFRLGQVEHATVKRDEFQEQYQTAQQTEAGPSITLTAQYYGYKWYAGFVASPILFYLLGSFVIVYIIGTLFNRARRRGE